MFCDLVGSTERSTRMDPEDLRDVIAAYHALIGKVIAPFGGFLAQYLGDGALVYFGFPQAHDNDAERAIRSALSLISAVAALCPHGQVLQVRVGAATGSVVVADIIGAGRQPEKGAIGETPNLAARLQALAEPNTVVIAETTRKLAGRLFECADCGLHRLKGFSHPVRVWQVLGTTADQDRCQSPLAGRRAELAQLRAILDTCTETGTGRLIYIRGEAGIGKSRLLEEFLSLTRQEGYLCHRALLLDFGASTGRHAIHCLARDVLGLPANATEEALHAGIEEAVRSEMIRSEDAVFLSQLIEVPQNLERRATHDAMDITTRDAGSRSALMQLVATASQRQPRVIAIEDLQWADAFTLAHIAALAATTTGSQVILIVTSRHESDPLDLAWRAKAGAGPITTLDLGPLTSQEASLLASSLLRDNAALVGRCVERASGNPLFLEQLVRNTIDGAGLDVPSSVQGLVQARLDRLDALDKAALQTASILGQRFESAAFGHIFAHAGYPAERLLQHHMIAKQDDQFVFSHALVREAIYASLLKSRRRELHRRASRWFAQHDPVLKAEHLDRAEDAAAPRAYFEAARLAYSNYRHELARGLADRGLTITSDRQERHELAYLLGDITHDLGDMAAALKAFEEAQNASSSHGERCRAWIGCARVKRITEDLDGAFADLQRGEEIAVPHGLKEEEARLRSLRGNLYFPRGHIDACLREHTRSLELARELGMPALEAAALGGLGDAEYVRGRMHRANSLLTDCVALSHRSGFGRIEVAHDAQLANTMIYLCPQAEALAHARKATAAASRIGHLRAELHATLVSLICLLHLEDWQGAESEVRHAQTLVARLGARRFKQNFLIASAQIANAKGRSQEALEELRCAAAISRQMGTGFLGPIICGFLATASHEPDARRTALAEGEALIGRGCVGHNQLRFYPMAIDVALELCEWDNADRYARELEVFCAPEPLPWSNYFVERARLLATMGRDGVKQTAALQSLLQQGERLGYVASLGKVRDALR